MDPPAGTFGLREYQPEMSKSEYPAADYYLQAVRQLNGSSGISQFNTLMANPDYRRRFFDAYPQGREDGLIAALGEIQAEIGEVLQGVFLAAEALAADPLLQDEFIAATAALYLRPALNLSDSENQRLDAKLVQVQKRIAPGAAQNPDIENMPFSGFRESTRALMQGVASLKTWKGAIVSPSKSSIGFAAMDAAFQSSQDWSDILVGAEDDAATLFATTTEALIQLNCDPTGQGFNLGWIVGYTGIWVATIVVFEAAMALESPI